MLSELFTSVSAKVAAASFAAVTTVGTGAAAATGNLPDEMQDGVSRAAASVGIELPDSGQDISAADVRQDTDNRQDEGNRQDDGEGQDAENHGGEGTDTDDAVLDTLSGTDPTEDGEQFGEDVSTTATEDGETLGEDVSGAASDDAATTGNDASTTGNDASTTGNDASTTGDDAAADESGASEGEYPEDAPSDSGERDNAESDADSNPGDDHRN